MNNKKNRIGISIVGIILAVITILFFISLKLNAGPNDIVNIPDKNLRAAINERLGFEFDHKVTEAEMLNLKELYSHGIQVSHLGIKNVYTLDGLQYAKNLSLLFLDEVSIRDYSILQYLPLKDLQINYSNFQQISKLPLSLQELDLRYCKIGKIEGLDKFTNLTKLSLSSNKISKIEGLDKLTNLKELVLENNKIRKIEGLDKLTNLTLLSLSRNQISKIEGLDKLTNLTDLNLTRNQIAKIEGLDKLTNLTDLDLTTNRIAKIEGLDKLTNLTKLRLWKNKISKIEGLGKLTNLTKLHLGKNQISKIENLDNLVNLVYLYLVNNQISKIENLDNLTNLTLLQLQSNQISKIEGLDKLTNLTSLGLSSNQISKIENLDNLVNLTSLGLSSNQIAKIEGLDKLSKLYDQAQIGVGLRSQTINININSKEFDLPVKDKIEYRREKVTGNITSEFANNIVKIGENRYKINNEGAKKLKEKKEIFKWGVGERQSKHFPFFGGSIYATTSLKEKDFFEEKIEKNKKVKVGENLDITTLLLNKPDNARVEKVEDINTNTSGLKKGKIKVIFSDESFKEIEVEVSVISTSKEKDSFNEEVVKNKCVKVGEKLDLATLLLNKPENARVEVVSDINTNSLGKKRGKIKVIFSDGSFKEIDIEVFVNTFDVQINYINKKNKIVKSEVKEVKIDPEKLKKGESDIDPIPSVDDYDGCDNGNC